MDDSQYEHMTKLALEFESSLGNRLQWYLRLKALFSANYVSGQMQRPGLSAATSHVTSMSNANLKSH